MKALSARPRVVSLDVLRGIAVLLVLGRHMTPPPAGAWTPVEWLASWWIQVGWTGVDLFFVLSGFLVSGLLFAEYQRHGSVDTGRFLVRRGFKIYPSFYFMIAVTIIVAIATNTLDASMAAGLGAELLYVQNYFPGIWNHTWSLAVEEHFYLLLAICVAALLRRRARTAEPDPFRIAVRLAIFIVIAITGARVLAPYGAVYSGRSIDPTALSYTTHTRIDTLLVGVILSYLYHFHGPTFAAAVTRRRLPIACASAALLTPPFLWRLGESPWMPSVGLLSIALGFGGVLALSVVALGTSPAPGRTGGSLTRAFAFVGVHSYSVYLWHMPVAMFAMPYVRRTVLSSPDAGHLAFLIGTGAYFAIALAAGVLIGVVVERPALRLRDRLFPTRSAAMPAPARSAPSTDQLLLASSTGPERSCAEDGDVRTTSRVPHRL